MKNLGGAMVKKISRVKKISKDKIQAESVTPMEDMCSSYYLKRAARSVGRQYEKMMKSAGLKSGQFSILSVVSHYETLSITELAKKMGFERTTLSRNLRGMEKEGLITISDEGTHRRRGVEVTKLGAAQLKKALPLWNKAQSQFTEQLGREDVEVLKKLLKRTAELTS